MARVASRQASLPGRGLPYNSSTHSAWSYADCWGFGGYGALGYGNTQNIGDNETPAKAGDVPLSGRALSLSVGAHHSCALLEQGLSCWGASGSGRLGYGNGLTIGDDEPASSAGFVEVQ